MGMPGCLPYLHLLSLPVPPTPLQAPKTTTTILRVASLEERVESLAEERVERAMPMATTTTMTTMMMIIILILLTTLLGLIPTAHIALSVGMTIGDTQVARAKIVKANIITTTDIGSTFLVLPHPHHHPHRPKEERPRAVNLVPRVESLAPKAERAMRTVTIITTTTMMMMTIGMVVATLTLVEADTTALDMDQATTLDMDTVMMTGALDTVVMMIGATRPLTLLGRMDQDTMLVVGRSPLMFHVPPILQASQGRQRKAKRWLLGKLMSSHSYLTLNIRYRLLW